MLKAPVLGHLTYREWHAGVNGFYKGLVEGGRSHEYEREKHYWRAGYSVGFLIRYGVLYLLLTQM